MKNVFLVFLLAISFGAFAQGLGITSQRHQLFLFSRYDLQVEIEGMEWNPTDIFEQEELWIKNTPLSLMGGNIVQVYDSIYAWTFDTANEEWVYNRRYIELMYDSKYNLTAYTEQVWDGLQWQNSSQANYEYDDNNNLISEVIREWNVSGWENSSRITSEYDENNNQTSTYSQEWNINDWQNIHKTISTYDASNNKLTSKITQFGNGAGWDNDRQFLYTYDSCSNLKSEQTFQSLSADQWKESSQVIYTYNNCILINTLEQDWGGNGWVNDNLEVYLYDTNDSLIQSVYKIWKKSNNAWEDYLQTYFTYDEMLHQNIRTYQSYIDNEWQNNSKYIDVYDTDKRVIEKYIQLWSDSTWENFLQTLYTFDFNNNLTMQTSARWRDEGWRKRSQQIMEYDADSFIKYVVIKSFSDDGITINYGDSTFFYFHKLKVPSSEVANDLDVNVFPNPNNGMFTVHGKSIHSVSIFNPLGQKIYSLVSEEGLSEIDISIQNPVAGIYSVLLVESDKLIVKQVFVQ